METKIKQPEIKPVPEIAYSFCLAICEWSTTTNSWTVISYKDTATAWEHFTKDIEARGKHGYLLNYGSIMAEC